jgi:glycosyltransferase involved in cell wall biosynthesis
MKILFFIESLRSGGKERRLVELIKGLSKQPKMVIELVLTRKQIHYRDILSTGVVIHYAIRKGLRKDPRIFYIFHKIAKALKPDIIHVWGNMVAVYAIPTKMILGVPMINSQVTTAPNSVKSGILGHYITFRMSDKILSNTYAGLLAYGVPKQKGLVIYNGFDFERISMLDRKDTIKAKLNITSRHVIGMVASFSTGKDYKTYIDAANRVLKANRNVTFLCIGSGEYKSYCKFVSADNTSNILFMGRQLNVEQIMSICDIGVLTTNIHVHGEGISNALLEFSALGKPIIATNNGGTPEIIEHGVNGFLIDAFSAIELTRIINQLLDDAPRRESMGILGRNKVKSTFGIDRMIEGYLNLYENL